MKISFILTILMFCSTAYAEGPILMGNALLKPIALEKLIRGSIISALKNTTAIAGGNTFPYINNDQIYFQTSRAINQTVSIAPQSGVLNDTLTTLGIKESVNLTVAPLQANFLLPSTGLNLDIKNNGTNTFLVIAKWSVTKLNIKTDTISIQVPTGAFDRPFSINSKPVEFGLSPHSASIQMEATLTVKVSEEGTKVHLEGFKTNLTDSVHPDFDIQLGPLTVDNQPLTLEIDSNGHAIKTSESKIRALFQKLDGSLTKTIREKLAAGIQTQIDAQSKTIDSKEPFQFAINTNAIVNAMKISSSIKALIGGIDFKFNLNFLQAIKSSSLYSAQVSSSICFDGECLSDFNTPSDIGIDDIKLMNLNDDTGAILYESALQAVVHSDTFQTRIRTFYESVAASPGVTLAPAGVKIYLNPEQNSVMAVLNLEIDIGKTVTNKTPFGEALRKSFGSIIESWVGSGKFVKIPVEINFVLDGLKTDMFGKQTLNLTTILPFNSDGTLDNTGRCPSEECPSNVDEMTSTVRKSFLKSVNDQLHSAIPETISIPVDDSTTFGGFTVSPKNFRITPNHGLLISAQLNNVTGGKK